jgi:hypothetical protein
MPWEQSTRPDGVSTEHDGVRTILHAASWLQLQSGFGFAYAFLETGWRLLDLRGAAPA